MHFLPILIASIVALVVASGWIIRYSLLLARILGVSTVVVGFILVSVSTSLPELFVAIFSALDDNVNLTVGNVFGSNMFDLTFIMGVVAVVAGGISMKQKETLALIELLFITSLVTLFIFQLSSLSILHGLILLALFGYLIAKLYKGGRVSKDIYDHVDERKHVVVLKFLGSAALLIIAARLLVDSALSAADEFSVTATFIGVTLIAISTSLPELFIELRTIKQKQYGLAMGDLLGSAVTDITLVLGAASLLRPVHIDVLPLTAVPPLLISAVLLLWYSFSKKRRLSPTIGILLIAIYALFLLEQFGLLILFGDAGLFG